MLNDDAAIEGYRTAPNITRLLEHEVGHAIGLGHTDLGQGNIMYPLVLRGGDADPAGDRSRRPGRSGVHLPAPACAFTLATSAPLT